MQIEARARIHLAFNRNNRTSSLELPNGQLVSITVTSSTGIERRTMAANSSETFPLVLSTKYYLDVVTFKVEDTVYKVLRKPFIENSVVFNDMLSDAHPDTFEGLVDSKPILLEGVTKVDWEFFLSVLLEPNVSPDYGQLNEWLAILELSRKWIMKGMHEDARERINARRLFATSASKMISYGGEFQCSDWLIDGFLLMITRTEVVGLYLDEAILMESDKLLEVLRMREHWQCNRGITHGQNRDIMAGRVVRTIFSTEIQQLDEAYARIFSPKEEDMY